ncbi:MAG: ferrochelatase [Marinifilaceae bacterium]|jgi:ferrochelatase|nr:ferrochelatase [Marinifilaceae bacterium]
MKDYVLLVNLGTPNDISKKSVGKFLRQFLSDYRVINLNRIARSLLVNGIIVPFRTNKSFKMYQEIWTDRGSELMFNSEDICSKLQDKLGDEFEVELAMRYQKPSLNEVLERIRTKNPQSISIIPLFPQYASCTTGSIFEEIMKIISKWTIIPSLKFVSSYHDHDLYIDSIVAKLKGIDLKDYDYFLFSYHSLPLSQLQDIDNYYSCNCARAEEQGAHKLCYKCQAEQTSRLIAQKLNIKKEDYTICYQSRFSKNWLSPFTDKLLEELPSRSKKSVLLFSPSFITDCVETKLELEIEYKELFIKSGGQKFTVVEAVNSSDKFIDCLHSIINQ